MKNLTFSDIDMLKYVDKYGIIEEHEDYYYFVKNKFYSGFNFRIEASSLSEAIRIVHAHIIEYQNLER